MIHSHVIKIIRCLPSATFLIIMSLMVACTDENQTPPTTIPEHIYLSFFLNATGSNGSRAEDYFGTQDESFIDRGNLKILVFDKTEKLMDIFYDDGRTPSNVSIVETGENEFAVHVTLSPDKYDTYSEFAIVALANWRSDDADPRLTTDLKGHSLDKDEIGSLTIDNLKELTFSLNPEGTESASWIPNPSLKRGIPMFGARYVSLKGYDATVFGKANPMPLPDLSMIRAFSKIEVVNLDTAPNRPTIDNIFLLHRNTAGALMQEWEFFSNTDNVAATTLRSDPAYSNSAIPFQREGNRFSAYLPEMEFGSDSEKRKAIRIDLDMNGEKQYKWIFLAPYGEDGNPILQTFSSGDWAAIRRNYFYRFNISSLAFEFIIDADSWIFGKNHHIQLE